MSKFDVAVIGSGPGGYVAAIRCAQLGMKTALIEKYSTLGGTCLNVGCIPSKTLLDSSHHYEDAIKHFDTHGIEIPGDININFEKMIGRKRSVVEQTTKGIEFLMDKNKITVFQGLGSFVDDTHILVDGENKETIEAKNTIIATGSKPGSLPFITIDKERVITSTEALELKEIPKHLVVIGGGVIGLELGQVYKRLGAEVSVIEYADRITPAMDSACSRELTKVLKKQGVKFYLSHGVNKVERTGDTVQITATDKKGAEVSFEGDYCLVSVGRKPYTAGLNAEAARVQLNERGQVEVNDHLQTTASNIYAIGDVVRGTMLAHKAEEEGVLVAEFLAGQKPHIDYNLIPNVIYTWPEVASVGKTEEQLKEAGVQYKSGQFPMRALGRARASMDTDGFVKILADAATDEVLGVHMVGARVADLISEAVTAMEFRASAEDIARMSHAHPTYAEAVKEAALAATENRPLHI
ncbi:dihydrolipoyl dehydrogenase [Flavobacteriaceae bacterium]|uniref:dihydrolipoyl dehydrogenase n=1 Tax=Candidatus Arcticimaribacter forsetii TaxID=2820661 RepID=UPI002076DE2D|nr:dihydrolipoyl dehydrogenase [Candidatus Arcticimaribacter forsetii]MDA8698970.1 dihydrolipoyl dehydrogenase [Flavobacteriaceae bacterium]MDB2329384.1 dihydrolipoyl dehydrogenase [Flavobacteriaceae bacterium]MDB2345592.1 dihydrolipoyl dehydrogenase [Flavobacteriaceae bacterium]MDB4716780.1 dihydrolipoyl dehydrogenase [Flavobacteriaceae bacterium]MDB4751946.1 dihydrolipoyl dehydrogenase [Flavobacteriaceae bacterium]